MKPKIFSKAFITYKAKSLFKKITKKFFYSPKYFIKCFLLRQNIQRNKKFNKNIFFYISNFRTFQRVIYAHQKETMTQKWIKGMKTNETFWDIGANVGIFSFLAADKGMNVVAIEPLYDNVFNLYKTIELNPHLNENIMIVPACLSSRSSIEKLNIIDYAKVKNSLAGYSGVQFEDKINPTSPKKGNSDEILSFWMMGFSGDSLTSKLPSNFSIPNHIKIDVDGNEEAILHGLDQVLKSDYLKTVLIELDFKSNAANIIKKMNSYNFHNKYIETQNSIPSYKKSRFRNYIFRKN